jgi:hypothetical protein
MNEVLKINNSSINEIISSIFPVKELLTDDIIIAGGFPLSIFLRVFSTKEEFLPLLTTYILNNINCNFKGLVYTDIDLWAKEGASSSLIDNLLHSRSGTPIVSGGVSLSPAKKSKWANTFSVYSYKTGSVVSKNIQMIKVRQKSPEDLIQNFDLNICKVAWCNGELFVSKDVMDDVKSCELSFNASYKHGEENFVTKLYRSLRYIKYAKRYSLQPSDAICQYIFNTFLESDGENLKYHELPMQSQIVVNNYIKESTTTHRMYHDLISRSTYTWFANCKNFKEEWSLFLINHPLLKDSIESIINDAKSVSTQPHFTAFAQYIK